MKHRFLTILLAAAAATMTATAAEYIARDGWTWKSSSVCAPENEDIAGLEGIHDGDAATCWHSNWHAESGSPERSNPHWVMIDRGTDSTPFYGVSYLPRQSTANNACTQYMIYLRDEDMSNTPATSVTDIVDALGDADIYGTWDGTTDEKFAVISKASTARYILFVNVASFSSSSAACAEMNLLKKKVAVSTGKYNAVKIVPADGSEPHRIAIDGTNLNVSMSGTAVRLSNSGITVEYSLDEVSHYAFEEYLFEEEELYTGTKRDIYDNPFDLAVTPAEGELTELTEITVAAAAGALPSPNTACTASVVFRHGTARRRSISPAKMAELAGETAYTITGFDATEPGEYSLTIPEGFFLDSEGCRSNPLEVHWTLIENTEEPGGPSDSITDVEADCPTITLSRSGSDLAVGGITRASHVVLTSMSGSVVAKVPVSGHGTALIPVGSLAKGVYLLSAGNTTLKITL